MGDTKRWTVTYTKHMTQKRKVYQDGVLELHGSRGKVILYDDCEKLIDSRILKKDEVFECGGTLAFATHLVDIGDLEETHNHIPNFSVGGDMKMNEKAGIKGQKTRYSLSIENRRSTSQSVPPQTETNARHSNIRVDKKSEFVSFRAAQKSRPNATCTILRENKRTELLNHNALQNRPNSTQTGVNEWNALYTTQLTQKAKRYHDGILRLAVCGSHMNEVILLNEDGAVLCSQYLKSAECVKTGSTYKFPNYLVDICEPLNFRGEDLQKGPSEQVASSGSSSIDKFTTGRSMLNNKPDERIQRDLSKQAAGSSNSSAGKFTNNRRVLTNEPLRDACQIMSVLKKALPEESLVQRELKMEQAHSSQSSDFILLEVQSKDKVLDLDSPATKYSRNTGENNQEDDPQELNIGDATQIGIFGSLRLKSKAAQGFSTSGITILIDTDSQGKPSSHDYATSSNLLSGAVAPDSLATKPGMGFAEKCGAGLVALAAGPEVSDTYTSILPKSDEVNELSNTFSDNGLSGEPVDSLNDNVPLRRTLATPPLVGKLNNGDASSNFLKEDISPKESGMVGVQIPRHIKDENSDQPCAENTKAEVERCESFFSSGSSSLACAASNSRGNEFESFKQNAGFDDLPSFDLGI